MTTKFERIYSVGYRRGWEPGPAVLSPKMTPALIKAGYRPPDTLLRRENQIVWLGFYDGENNAAPPSGQGQACQNDEHDELKSTGGKGRSNTASEPIAQVKEGDVGRIAGKGPNWPFKPKPSSPETGCSTAGVEAATKGSMAREGSIRWKGDAVQRARAATIKKHRKTIYRGNQ